MLHLQLKREADMVASQSSTKGGFRAGGDQTGGACDRTSVCEEDNGPIHRQDLRAGQGDGCEARPAELETTREKASKNPPRTQLLWHPDLGLPASGTMRKKRVV